MTARLRRVMVMAVAALTSASAAPAVAHTQPVAPNVASPSVTHVEEQQNSPGHPPTPGEESDLPTSPQQRIKVLEEQGFSKAFETAKYGGKVVTYQKVTENGIRIEVDVNYLPEVTPFINLEWDWGPRVYMTGEEFWSLGASGIGGAICHFIGGGLIGGTACSAGSGFVWGLIAPDILKDQTCYDLSQFMNIGWEVAPSHKCA